MRKSLIIAIIASLVSTGVNAKSYTRRRAALRRSLRRKLHVPFSAVLPCRPDAYRAQATHGQACLRDLT